MPAVAPHRRGLPSPLVLHLGAAVSGYAQALLVAPRAGDPSFPWPQHLAEDAANLSQNGCTLGAVEVASEIGARLQGLVRGLEVWQGHPYRRAPDEPPALWAEGSSRLLDYGAAREATDPEGPPVLVVPSLINRAYVLDLLPERSMLRWLAAQGLRPTLLDWGPPGPQERGFGLEDYLEQRLMPALGALQASAARPVSLVGYCMGGTLAAGVAARAPDGLSALVTFGAPWNFAGQRGAAAGLRALFQARGAADAEAWLDAQGQAFGLVPDVVFQTLFALIDPMQAAVKFQRLAGMDPGGAGARRFVALEDWLADGVAMPAPAAKDLLIDWQLRNATFTGKWRFRGAPVVPEAIALPVLSFCGRADTIAPPPAAEALAAAIPGARIERPRTGHVGMVVGRAALAQVWQPTAAFLHAHAG